MLLGTFSEDGSIQGLLDVINLPYVGPDVLSAAICMDKDIAKRLLQEAGINIAKDFVYTIHQRDKINFKTLKGDAGDTMFVKPVNLGSSVAVNKISTKDEFDYAVDLVFKYDDKVIIEETIIRREIEFSVLGNENLKVSLPGEVIVDSELYSYESKYMDENDSKFSIPTIKLNTCSKSFTLKYFIVKDLLHVDFFLTNDNQIYVNELNTIPSFAKLKR